MGILRTALIATSWTGCGGAAAYALWTRKTRIVDVPPTDYLYHSTLFARYNPNNSPVTQDLALRRVPLSRIRPELLDKPDSPKLVEAFCAGVWGGLGMYIFFLSPLHKLCAHTEGEIPCIITMMTVMYGMC